MRFLVDECTGPVVASWLQNQGHDVFSVYEESRGLDDNAILAQAVTENRILVTNDKDFGEKIFREKQAHKGIVLLRLQDERASNKIAAVQRLLEDYADKLERRFVVVTESGVRIHESSTQNSC
jgi:predicted nuclease of predicted toxin-antitoxin system